MNGIKWPYSVTISIQGHLILIFTLIFIMESYNINIIHNKIVIIITTKNK